MMNTTVEKLMVMIYKGSRCRIPGKTILISILFIFCQSSPQSDHTLSTYEKEIEEWHIRRISALTRPDGWLSLKGLFWLKEGENFFGGDESNDIRFPGKNVPARMGKVVLSDGMTSVEIMPGVTVLHDSQTVTSLVLKNDMGGDPTLLSYGTLSWYVIRRGEKFGIRLKDSASATLKNFRGIERFPVDQRWQVLADFEPYDPPRKIEVPNITGEINQETSPGSLVFIIQGKKYRLDPIAKREDARWFIIFSDETNGKETYGAGRFLYIDAPDSSGKAIIDFNMAYNPPCAFTPYATCPLPPEQNHLALPVIAGEKNYQGYPH